MTNVYYKKTLRKSLAAVMRLQIGQSFVEPMQRSQHSRQQACQQPVLTVGSTYASRHILQEELDVGAAIDCEVC